MEVLTFLVSVRVRQRDVGDFHTDRNFDGGGDDKLPVCSTQRNSVEDQRSGYCSAQENHPLDSVAPSEDDGSSPGGSEAACSLPTC